MAAQPSVERLFWKVHARAFSHIKRPDLYVWPDLFGMYVAKGNQVHIFAEEHSNTGELLDTIVHELAHAEQKATGKKVADNKRHRKLMAKAWRKLF